MGGWYQDRWSRADDRCDCSMCCAARRQGFRAPHEIEVVVAVRPPPERTGPCDYFRGYNDGVERGKFEAWAMGAKPMGWRDAAPPGTGGQADTKGGGR